MNDPTSLTPGGAGAPSPQGDFSGSPPASPNMSQGGPALPQTDDSQPATPISQQSTDQPFDQPQVVPAPQQPMGQLGDGEDEALRLHGDESALGSLAVSSSGGKEVEPVHVVEEMRIEEEGEKEEVPEEVQGWVERVERGEDINLARTVVHQGQTLVTTANLQNAKIVLPLSEEATKLALHRRVVESVRWLAEWCWRLVKKLPRRVMYEEPKGIV